jgi:two-component system, cell cycle sensor histidine kinase and response regulator CckA
MQVSRDILLNRWTWLVVLTLLALGSLYQYASSKQHQSAQVIAETATNAEAAHVFQSLQRRLSDISEAISGTGTAGNDSSFDSSAGVLLRANPFLQAINHVDSDGVVSRVSSSPSGPTLAPARTMQDPLTALSRGVVLSEPFATEIGNVNYAATSRDGAGGHFELVFEAKSVFGAASPFRDRRDIALRITDGSNEIFVSPDYVDTSHLANYGTTVETAFLGREMRIYALPTEGLVAGSRDVWQAAAIGSMVLAVASAIAIIGGFAFSVRRHRLVEESLRGSEARYRDLYDEAPVAYMSVGPDGTVVEANREASEMFGYPLDDLIGRKVFELYPDTPDGIEKALEIFDRFKHGEDIRDVTLQHVRNDGRMMWGSLTVQPIIDALGNVVASRSALVDITERKLAEENERRVSHENGVLAEVGRIITSSRSVHDAYQDFAEQVNRLVQSDQIDIVTVDPEGGTLRVEYVSGLRSDDIAGQQGFTRPLNGTLLEKVMGRGTGILSVPRDNAQLFDDRPESARGSDEELSSLIAVPLVDGGSCIGMLTIWTTEPNAYSDADLSLAERVGAQISGAIANDKLAAERSAAAEALRASEERFRSMFEYSAGGTGVVDREGRFVQVNEAMGEILGYSCEELVGQRVSDLTQDDDWPETENMLRELWAGERSSYTIEKRYIHKDGHHVWCVASVSAILDAEGQADYALGQLQDVTELKQLQGQLLQSQKMEVVGQLAGGVAHDFNNLLTAIIGYTSLAKDSLPLGDRNRGHLEQVDSAAQRAATITRQLLAFSRREVSEPRVVELNDCVLGTVNMLRRLIGEDIELVTLPGADLGMVNVDPGQIEQVLVNMAVNARDAMVEGGKLTIETSNVVLGVGQAGRRVDLEPGGYVMISVEDTGTGIAEDIRDRLFEPFFTTREVGKGTGLGLATCYGIIKQSGGDIDFRSELGEGTTFHVYLPSLGVDVSGAQSHGERDLPRGNETVLLVEDEPAVRGLAAYVLRHQGYTVLEAENGEEALRVAAAHSPDIIDLLLTDVVMPRMGGKELAEHFHEELPETKIMFTSGYPGGGAPKGVDLDPGTPMLAKPFMPDAVADKVREVLDMPVLAS